MEKYSYIDGIRWYVVHTYSGYENKVKTNLEKIVDNRSLQDLIFDIRIPTLMSVEGEGESAKEVESKMFPSYVIVKMKMSDFTWHIVRNITGVTGFVGPGSSPTPLTDEEVAALGLEETAESAIRESVKRLPYSVGDSVRVTTGVFTGYVGRVDSISDDHKKVTVMVSMFGRETPAELDSGDVELLG